MDKLESWVTINSVKMEPGDDIGSNVMLLTTDDTEIGDTDFFLTQRGNLHSTRLKSSVTTCLYQGHVSKDKQTDVHSPVRIKYCDTRPKCSRTCWTSFLEWKSLHAAH